jgi:hypothetical protein
VQIAIVLSISFSVGERTGEREKVVAAPESY